MIKAYPHIDQGSGYVQISRLPLDQALRLKDWLPQTSFIKLKSDDLVMEDCIQYSEYEYWFDFLYTEQDKEAEFEI